MTTTATKSNIQFLDVRVLGIELHNARHKVHKQFVVVVVDVESKTLVSDRMQTNRNALMGSKKDEIRATLDANKFIDTWATCCVQ